MPVRVLLDECVPRQLRRTRRGFDVRTTQEMGWAGVKNGALISLAETNFDVILTVDRAFASPSQGTDRLGIVILEAGTTDPVLLLPHMPAVIAALQRVGPGEVLRVAAQIRKVWSRS